MNSLNPETEIVVGEIEQPIVSQSEKEELLEARAQLTELATRRALEEKIKNAKETYEKGLKIFTEQHFGLDIKDLSSKKQQLAADFLLKECRKIWNRFVAFASTAILACNYLVSLLPKGNIVGDLIFGTILGLLITAVVTVPVEWKFGTKSPFGPFSSMKFIRARKFLLSRGIDALVLIPEKKEEAQNE